MIKRPLLTTGRLGHFAAILFGALLPMAFAPICLWPCALFSLVGYLSLLHNLSPKQAAIRSFWYGLGAFGMGVSWVYVSMHEYGGTPLILAVLMTAAFAAFLALVVFGSFGYLYSRFQLSTYPILTFPALWVLSEWIRTWVLTGFPWLFVGYGMIDTPLSGYAPILGVLMVSWATATSAALIYWGARAPKQNLKWAVPILILIWGVGWESSQHHWTTLSETTTPISLIQSNIPQDQKWLPEQLPVTKALFRDVTIKEFNTSEQHAKVVIWPEAAITQFLNEAWPYVEEMDQLAKEHNAAIVTGVPHRERGISNYHYYNSIMSLGGDYSIYHKQKLVPFGEFIPWEKQLKNIVPFFGPMTSFSAGSPSQGPLKVLDQRWAPYICYEIVYPDFVRHYAKSADVLITISNDAWFGTSFGPHQHFEMTRMRALETGRYLVRGTNTGITGVIDDKGHVVAKLPQFVQDTLRSEIRTSEGITPFMQFGSAPLIVAVFLILLAAGLLVRRHASEEESESVSLSEFKAD